MFHVDINVRNNNNETARHIAAYKFSSKDIPNNILRNDYRQILYILHSSGAQRCNKLMNDCTDGCAYNGKDDGDSENWPDYDNETLYNKVLLQNVLTEALNNSDNELQNGNNNNNNNNKSPKYSRLICLDGNDVTFV